MGRKQSSARGPGVLYYGKSVLTIHPPLSPSGGCLLEEIQSSDISDRNRDDDTRGTFSTRTRMGLSGRVPTQASPSFVHTVIYGPYSTSTSLLIHKGMTEFGHFNAPAFIASFPPARNAGVYSCSLDPTPRSS